ncbi:MAG: hypothetical protein WGN25_18085 [Candidatus Electrothrix sp. GW3-4]|uniref:hypothetical protein n=1 Tax=Candidatus Electrothrix sp. GW3-4 TaxID=3126740 RepID=UPI0030D36BD2
MNNRTKKQGFFLSLLILGLPLFFSVQGQAHGVHGDTGSGSKAICTSASYEDGESMSYATVEIIAPNAKLPFQTGRTDRNGYFCFRPDTPGRWKITVKDEDGHFIRLGTKVSKEMLNDE